LFLPRIKLSLLENRAEAASVEAEGKSA